MRPSAPPPPQGQSPTSTCLLGISVGNRLVVVVSESDFKPQVVIVVVSESDFEPQVVVIVVFEGDFKP